jgi:AbrB family looped-hinge helix DNA binding protein
MTTVATVSSKGQLVIPSKLRKKYGLKAGLKVYVGEADGKIVIQLNRFDALMSLRGTLAGYPLEQELTDDPIRRKE